MADISAEITAFKNAIYGEDVRNAMVSLANKLNDVVSNANFYRQETLTNNTDCDTHTDFGTYYCNSVVFPTLVNGPGNAGYNGLGGTIITLPYLANKSVIAQYFISYMDPFFTCYRLYRSNKWSKWYTNIKKLNEIAPYYVLSNKIDDYISVGIDPNGNIQSTTGQPHHMYRYTINCKNVTDIYVRWTDPEYSQNITIGLTIGFYKNNVFIKRNVIKHSLITAPNMEAGSCVLNLKSNNVSDADEMRIVVFEANQESSTTYTDSDFIAYLSKIDVILVDNTHTITSEKSITKTIQTNAYDLNSLVYGKTTGGSTYRYGKFFTAKNNTVITIDHDLEDVDVALETYYNDGTTLYGSSGWLKSKYTKTLYDSFIYKIVIRHHNDSSASIFENLSSILQNISIYADVPSPTTNISIAKYNGPHIYLNNVVTISRDKALASTHSLKHNQGAQQYGQYLLLGAANSGDGCNTYDLFNILSGVRLASITISDVSNNCHNNSVNFDTTIASDSMFPLVYLSYWHDTEQCDVVKISGNETDGFTGSKIQSIYLDHLSTTITGAGYADWAVDDQYLYLFRYHNVLDYEDGPTNTQHVTIFNKPDVSNSSIYLEDSDIVDHFTTIPMYCRQQVTVYKNNIVYAAGSANFKSFVHVVNLLSREVSSIDLTSYLNGSEPEGITVFDNKIDLTAANKYIYSIYV